MGKGIQMLVSILKKYHFHPKFKKSHTCFNYVFFCLQSLIRSFLHTSFIKTSAIPHTGGSYKEYIKIRRWNLTAYSSSTLIPNRCLNIFKTELLICPTKTVSPKSSPCQIIAALPISRHRYLSSSHRSTLMLQGPCTCCPLCLECHILRYLHASLFYI